VKNIGKPCAGKPHARFDEGGQARACSLLYLSPFAQYVSSNRPDLKNRVIDITDLYVQLRYRDQASKPVLAEFVQKVKAFDPVLK